MNALSPCSVHGINDFLQLVRSRYQPYFANDVPLELETAQPPEFEFSLLQEDIVAYFLAGKPLICIEPPTLLRIPFQFRQSTTSAVEAGHVAEWVGCICVWICVSADMSL